MNKSLTAVLIILLGSAYGFGQNHPDKLVFKGDAATIDSLKRTDYPYLFPFWGDEVQKMGITMPLSAGIGLNYVWQESDISITNLEIGFNQGPMTDLAEVVRINSAVAKASGVNIRPDL